MFLLEINELKLLRNLLEKQKIDLQIKNNTLNANINYMNKKIEKIIIDYSDIEKTYVDYSYRMLKMTND